MTPDDIEQCLSVIGAAYRMARRGFDWENILVREFYRDELMKFDVEGDAAFLAIKDLCRTLGRPPDTPELREKMSSLRRFASDAEKYRSPVKDAEPSGKTPRELIREGFMEAWHRDHPGLPLPPQAEQWMDMMPNVNGRK